MTEEPQNTETTEEAEETPEEELPAKPDPGPMPSDAELEQEDAPGEEAVPEAEVMDRDTAAADPTVDDQEDDEPA